MRIENINTGVCHSRIQQGEPAFFVNWRENGKQQYRFFSIVSAMYNFKERLTQRP